MDEEQGQQPHVEQLGEPLAEGQQPGISPEAGPENTVLDQEQVDQNIERAAAALGDGEDESPVDGHELVDQPLSEEQESALGEMGKGAEKAFYSLVARRGSGTNPSEIANDPAKLISFVERFSKPKRRLIGRKPSADEGIKAALTRLSERTEDGDDTMNSPLDILINDDVFDIGNSTESSGTVQRVIGALAALKFASERNSLVGEIADAPIGTPGSEHVTDTITAVADIKDGLRQELVYASIRASQPAEAA